MAEKTGISWCALLPKPFAAFQSSLVTDAFWFEVSQLMAAMTQSSPVRNIEPQFREILEWFDVVRPEIATPVVSAILAGVTVALKNSGAPFQVFGATPITEVPLCLSVLEGVVVFTARGSLPGPLGNNGAGFWGMLYAGPIAAALLGGFAHFLARFVTHLFALHGRNKSFLALLPRFADFLLGFLGMSHINPLSIIIHSNPANYSAREG